MSTDQQGTNTNHKESVRAANPHNSLSDVSHPSEPVPAPSSAPISLSLLEYASPTSGNNTDTTLGQPPSTKRLHIRPRRLSLSLNGLNSPDEDAGQVYEYFPLGLDDWQPPDDAVYRPHFVHHRKLSADPYDPRTSVKGSRNKRYFSEGVF